MNTFLFFRYGIRTFFSHLVKEYKCRVEGTILYSSQPITLQIFFRVSDNKPIEGLYIEFNFRKRKWLLRCSYNPNKNRVNHLDALRREI